MYRDIARHWMSTCLDDHHYDGCWMEHAACAVEYLFNVILFLEDEIKDIQDEKFSN